MAKNETLFFGEYPVAAGVPRWASFFNGAEFRRFLIVVEAELTRREVAVFGLVGAAASLEGPERTIERQPLTQLARACVTAHPDAWPRLVREHFKGLFARHSLAERLADYGRCWATAAEVIVARIVPEAALGARGPDGVAARRIAPGLCAQLVYEIDDQVIPVPVAHVQTWLEEMEDYATDEREELLATALENIDVNRYADIAPIETESGREVFVLAAADDFAATHVVHTETFLDSPAPSGMLVAVPDARHVVFARVEPETLRELIRTMQPLVRHLAARATTPLSTTIHYAKDGVLRPLDAVLRELLDELSVAGSLAWASGAN